MTLYDDDLPPRVAEQLERRHHAPSSQRQPWVHDEDFRDQALSALDEKIAACADELDGLRRERARIASGEADVLRPVLDARCFPSMGTDAQETWRDAS